MMRDISSHNLLARNELDKLTSQLLSPRSEKATLRDPTIAFRDLLGEISGLTEGTTYYEDLQNTTLAGGLAIAPRDAIRSILDYYRTVQYLRGTHAAISKARQKLSRAPLEVLYAGCGPFAPFALALATKFSPEEVRFTLLDVHSRSLETAKHIFEVMGL